MNIYWIACSTRNTDYICRSNGEEFFCNFNPDPLLQDVIEQNRGMKMIRELHPCVYILTTNKNNHVLYTGVTSNVFKRVAEHKDRAFAGFTSSYNVTKLVYYEEFGTLEEAIAREKQIKGGPRKKKIDLINSMNPGRRDLYEDFFA